MVYVWSLKNSQQMSKRSIRIKVKIILPLFKTMEHFYSELHSQFRLHISGKGEDGSGSHAERWREAEPGSSGTGFYWALLVQLVCWLRNPAWRSSCLVGMRTVLHKWTMVQAVKCIDDAKWSVLSGEKANRESGKAWAGASIWFFSVERWRKTRYLLL